MQGPAGVLSGNTVKHPPTGTKTSSHGTSAQVGYLTAWSGRRTSCGGQAARPAAADPPPSSSGWPPQEPKSASYRTAAAGGFRRTHSSCPHRSRQRASAAPVQQQLAGSNAASIRSKDPNLKREPTYHGLYTMAAAFDAISSIWWSFNSLP
jgi:hypothetical protein